MRRTRNLLSIPVLLLVMLFAGSTAALAGDPPANAYFERTWERTDLPVATGKVPRTWMWGPGALTGEMFEPYAGAHNNGRAVQYFDKSRMEINHQPGVPSDSPWFVTNGLLAQELMSGMLQVGDTQFEYRQPAELPVAGDLDASSAPTYAALNRVADLPARAAGHVIDDTLDRNGATGRDASLARYDVTAYYFVQETGHQVAEPFWYFMTSTGPVWEDGRLISDELFLNPFYATGFPLTEAYWVRTTVGGHETDVLVQAFERRVLTYTPSNAPGWQVESGNVGLHYYLWRYGHGPEEPRENAVVTSIPTGPETIEYFAKGNPRPGELDWGPSAFSVASDGTWWLADPVAHRVVQFDARGERGVVIDLDDQGGKSVWDVDARTGTIWVSWANLDLGIYKLQAYDDAGTLLRDVDLPATVWQHPDYLSHRIVVDDTGAVFMEMRLGLELVRVIDAAGHLNPLPAEYMTFGGHTYRLAATEGVLDRVDVVVDGHAIPIRANDGAFAVQVNLVPVPDANAFVITRYSVYGDGTMDFTIERRAIDGSLLGVTTVPEAERYAYVDHDLSSGPGGGVYKLMAYQDRLEVLRLGFDAG